MKRRSEDWRMKTKLVYWSEDRVAWLCISTANRRLTAGAWGNILLQCMRFVTIIKSILKSRFFARFQPDFTHFWFFQTIQHTKHVLTRKIIRFYESKRDFNNLVCNSDKIIKIASGGRRMTYLVSCCSRRSWGRYEGMQKLLFCFCSSGFPVSSSLCFCFCYDFFMKSSGLGESRD
jgi:hypothetical protein